VAKVKICGVTNLEDALASARTGADYIGLNFYRPGPRYIDFMVAQLIAGGLRVEFGERRPLLVGVFVDEPLEVLKSIADGVGLDFLQLHGDEPPELVAALNGRAIKAIRPQSVEEAVALAERYAPVASGDERAPSLLVDAYHPALRGGTGEQASAEVAQAIQARVPRLMLAGGLTPGNVGERVAAIQPWAVDTASGVESGDPRKKDIAKVEAFIHAARDQNGRGSS
jgi:phosphoribosylanthranilate isomerase